MRIYLCSTTGNYVYTILYLHFFFLPVELFFFFFYLYRGYQFRARSESRRLDTERIVRVNIAREASIQLRIQHTMTRLAEMNNDIECILRSK